MHIKSTWIVNIARTCVLFFNLDFLYTFDEHILILSTFQFLLEILEKKLFLKQSFSHMDNVVTWENKS